MLTVPPLIPRLLLALTPLATIAAAFFYFSQTNVLQPTPYIDEIFHIPQTQQYCKGHWNAWDSKITTPPGLYIIGYAWARMLTLTGLSESEACSTLSLRAVNLMAVVIYIPATLYIIQRRVWGSQAHFSAFSLVSFPLIWFYAALYYTDVWSTATVLMALAFALSPRVPFYMVQLSALMCAVSLFFRQTNILWAAVVAVIAIENSHYSNGAPPKNGALAQIFSTISYTFQIELPIFNILISYASVAVGFSFFLYINGGIALGDKGNHVAGNHIPQVFYCALFITTLGFPVWFTWAHLKAYISSSFSVLGLTVRPLFIFVLIPRLLKSYAIEHPFLLADNRHYVFYLWRRLLKPAIYSISVEDVMQSQDAIDPKTLDVISIGLKYALSAAIYFSLWNIWTTLTNSIPAAILVRGRGFNRRNGKSISPAIDLQCLTWPILLAMVFATLASLIPSPLIEPRYYILPYLFWRIYMTPTTAGKRVNTDARFLREWIWYMLINAATVYMFLYKPFEWAHEPGVLQRFMW